MNVDLGKVAYELGRLQQQVMDLRGEVNKLNNTILEIRIDVSKQQTDEAKEIIIAEEVREVARKLSYDPKRERE